LRFIFIKSEEVMLSHSEANGTGLGLFAFTCKIFSSRIRLCKLIFLAARWDYLCFVWFPEKTFPLLLIVRISVRQMVSGSCEKALVTNFLPCSQNMWATCNCVVKRVLLGSSRISTKILPGCLGIMNIKTKHRKVLGPQSFTICPA
jgi:hypothetical protein